MDKAPNLKKFYILLEKIKQNSENMNKEAKYDDYWKKRHLVLRLWCFCALCYKILF